MNSRIFKSMNWRIIRDAFRSPSRLSPRHLQDCNAIETEDSIFLPYNQEFDVIGLRDWLHDLDNNTGGFQLIGCFEKLRNKYNFVGLKLVFTNSLDAVFFRLAWA